MLDVNKLRETNRKKKELRLKNYHKIFKQCCNKIKMCAKLGNNECWYIVPNIMIGLSSYKQNECCKYLYQELNKTEFTKLEFYEPNIFFISWE